MIAQGAQPLRPKTSYEKNHVGEPFDNLKANQTGLQVLAQTYEELGLSLGDPDRIFGSSDAGNVSMVCPTFHPQFSLSSRGLRLTREPLQKQ